MPARAAPLRRGLSLVLWLGGILALIALVVGALLAATATDPGRRLIADQIGRYAPENGLRIAVGSIEGAPLRRFTARDVVLSDPKGRFLEIEEVTIDWRPLDFLLENRLTLNDVASPRARLLRRPELVPSEEEDQPILPGFDIALGRLAIDTIVVEPPVAGRRIELNAGGAADVAQGRAQLRLNSFADSGDRLAILLDARPDDDQFDLGARLSAPRGGLVMALLGLDRPLDIRIDGDGAWSRWQGEVRAGSGEIEVARAALTNDNGRFRLAGDFRLAELLGPGIPARLAGPALRLEAEAARPEEGGPIALSLSARSRAGEVEARGPVDLQTSRLGGIRIAGTLADPSLLSQSVAAAPLRFVAVLSGPLARPAADVSAETAYLGVGETRLASPRLTATVGWQGALARVDLRLTAPRATGLPAEFGALATNLVLEGPLTYDGKVIAGDRLVLRTDRIRSRLTLAYTLATGTYLVALNGELPRYDYPGIGSFAINADLRIVPGPRGIGIALSGPVRARAVRLEPGAFAELAGGLPVITGRLTRGPAGDIALDGFRLAAPRLSLAGRLALSASGRLAADARGRSADYGPVALALSGTADAPVIDLRLQRPGLGVGLEGVSARIVQDGEGYRIRATGRSDFGPAAVVARVGTGPLVIDIARAEFAGVIAKGRITQAGPVYAGALDVAGSGVSGRVTLANAGGEQQVAANLLIDDARLPGLAPPVTIGSGRLIGSAILHSDGPSGEARLSASGISRGDLRVTRLDASGRYARGSGSLSLSLAGQADEPFSLDARAALQPRLLTLTAEGAIAGETVRLENPAVLTREGADWRLAPTTIALDGGRATLAGTWGQTPSISATIRDFNLTSLEEIGALNVSGVLSAEARVVLPAGGLPAGSVNLNIRNFSRSGLALTSAPVNLEVVAAGRGQAIATRGYVRRQGRALGAFQVALMPIPSSGASTTARLLAAPLQGLLRLQGPAEAIWPLAGIETVDVRGPIAVAANISGRAGDPLVSGVVRTTRARIESASTGTVITNAALNGRFVGPRLEVLSFTGEAGDGRVTGAGVIEYAAGQGIVARLNGSLADAELFRTDTARATLSGPYRVGYGAKGGVVAAELDINRARYQVGGVVAETVPTLVVREVGAPPGGRPRPVVAETQWALQVKATARNQIAIRGMGLDSEWRADVEARGSLTEPRLNGTVELVRGTYDFAGTSFELERGTIRFQGQNPPNPVVNIQAVARVTDLTAIINITGTALRPEIAFTSSPALPEDEVLSRLLFGTSVTDLSALEAVQLAAALNSLRGGGGGFNPVSAVRNATGLDRLRISGADEATGRGTTVAAGKYIGRNIYVEFATDAEGYTATQLEILLSRSFSLLSTVQSNGGQRVSVRWSKDY